MHPLYFLSSSFWIQIPPVYSFSKHCILCEAGMSAIDSIIPIINENTEKCQIWDKYCTMQCIWNVLVSDSSLLKFTGQAWCERRITLPICHDSREVKQSCFKLSRLGERWASFTTMLMSILMRSKAEKTIAWSISASSTQPGKLYLLWSLPLCVCGCKNQPSELY